jgi:hypothetical protein
MLSAAFVVASAAQGLRSNQRLAMYIVISKPKRRSVNAGVLHVMMISSRYKVSECCLIASLPGPNRIDDNSGNRLGKGNFHAAVNTSTFA